MRFVGIDIGAERHTVASVDEGGTILHRPAAFREDAAGYQQLLAQLGPPADTLVDMEATGHYWQNLFAALAAEGFAIALNNPEHRRIPELRYQSGRGLRAYYQRLRDRGKLPKVVLMAAMRKLLIAIYTVAKHRRPFVPIIPLAAP